MGDCDDLKSLAPDMHLIYLACIAGIEPALQGGTPDTARLTLTA